MNKRTLARYTGKQTTQHMTTNRLIEDKYYPQQHDYTPMEVRQMSNDDKLIAGIHELVHREYELVVHSMRKELVLHTRQVERMMENMRDELMSMIKGMTVTVGFTNTVQVVDTIHNNVQLATQYIIDKAKRLDMSFSEVHALTPDIKVDMSMVLTPAPVERIKRKYNKRGSEPLMNSVVFTPKAIGKPKRGGRTSKDGTRIDWLAYKDDDARRNAGFIILEAHIQAYKDSSPTKFSKQSQSVYGKLMDLCKKDEVKR
jgi:hypothetical protein